MRLVLSSIWLMACLAAASSKIISVQFDNPHADSVWLLGASSVEPLKMTVMGELPKDARIGIFSYGWFRDRLIFSIPYADLEDSKESGEKIWTFPENFNIQDGQYVVKVYRKRQNWFKKVFGKSLSFQILSVGQQTLHGADKMKYVEHILPFGLNKNSMVYEVKLSESFRSKNNAELQLTVFDADTTEQAETVYSIFVRIADGELLKDESEEGESRVTLKADGLLYVELPIIFSEEPKNEDALRSLYIEVATRQNSRFRRNKPLLIYRVSCVISALQSSSIKS